MENREDGSLSKKKVKGGRMATDRRHSTGGRNCEKGTEGNRRTGGNKKKRSRRGERTRGGVPREGLNPPATQPQNGSKKPKEARKMGVKLQRNPSSHHTKQAKTSKRNGGKHEKGLRSHEKNS